MEVAELTNEIFGKSKAIHSPIDLTIKNVLNNSYGSYIESTNENDKTPSVKRRMRWENCQEQIRNYLDPFIDLSRLEWAYPTNGIHESIDWMCNKVSEYQVFEGEYRYPTFIKKPVNIAKTTSDLVFATAAKVVPSKTPMITNKPYVFIIFRSTDLCLLCV